MSLQTVLTAPAPDTALSVVAPGGVLLTTINTGFKGDDGAPGDDANVNNPNVNAAIEEDPAATRASLELGTAALADTGDFDAAGAAATAATNAAAALAAHVAASDPHTGYALESTIGAANGLAPLDSGGKVAAAYLPSYVDDVVEAANFAALPGTGETGKIYVTLDNGKAFRWSGSAYVEIVASPGSTDAVPEGSTNLYFTAQRVRDVVLTGLSLVTNLAITATDTVLTALGRLQAQITALIATVTAHTSDTANPHSVTKTQVGLGNVDNTSDANKPVSTAQAAADAVVLASAAADATTKADAKVVDSIADGDTTHAPSRNAVFDALALKADSSSLGTAASLASDTDGTLAANSDARMATQKATKTYADAIGTAAASDATTKANAAKAYADTLVVGLIDDRGNYNASGNVFPSSGGSGSAGAVLKGDLWTVSVAGTLGGTAVTAGDLVRALVDTPGQTSSNWAVTENNIGYVAENSANKDTDGTLAANSDTKYPSQKAAKTYADAVSTSAQSYADGKVIDSIADSDTTHAPSRNSVFDALALKVPTSRTVNGQALSADVSITSVSGNAGTATALQTARLINGVSFDGSADIIVQPAAPVFVYFA